MRLQFIPPSLISLDAMSFYDPDGSGQVDFPDLLLVLAFWLPCEQDGCVALVAGPDAGYGGVREIPGG